MGKIEGRVSKYFEKKGYGFVRTFDLKNDDSPTGTDVFVHISDVPDEEELRVDWMVKGELQKTEKGYKLEKVHVVRKKRPSRPKATNKRKSGKIKPVDKKYGRTGEITKNEKSESKSGYRWVGDKLKRTD